MEIHVLGTVELSVHGRAVMLESDKVRCLTAALAIDAGRPVPMDTLIARLWDDEPPAKARATAHSYLSRLRNALRLAQRVEDGPPSAVITRSKSHSYVLDTDPQRVDYLRFFHLGRRASALADAGDDRQALAVLRDAEAIWQAEPLAGLPGAWAQATRNTMHDQWLATTLTRFEVELRLGRFIDLVPEASALADQRPSDERVAGYLMTALYGSGRQAEALAVFQRTRRELRGRLGAEPGEQLKLLQQRVLHRLPIAEILPRSKMAASPSAPAGQAGARRSYLPVLPQLVGREAELRWILSAGDRNHPEEAGGTVRAISGMGGSGKTCLAVTAAHLLKDRFPDGQLYVDLRANGGARQPVETEAAATSLLRQFGVAAAAIPSERDELLSRCRDLLAERRAVVVLDDASGPKQVRPLLPGVPASAILITSRHRLTELPCSPLFLDPLPPDDAAELFTRRVGKGRAADPASVEAIVALCERLPLALELLAGRFRAHPSWSLRNLVQRLSRKGGRLNELRHGFESVALVFDVSYQSLPGAQQEAFRLLGIHPGPDFGAESAAALLGRSPSEADRALESLHTLHMLEEHSPERYVLHDLLREYAGDLVTAEEGDQAIRRLVSFAISAADRADRIISPRRFRLPLPEQLQLPPTATLVSELDWRDERDVKAWLSTELPSLTAIQNHAGTTGMAEEAAWLAHVLAAHLEDEGLWREAAEMHRVASDHWRTYGLALPEAHALLALASIQINAGQYQAAARACERALGIARSSGEATYEAEALERIAKIHWQQSDLDSALSILQDVVEVRRSSEDQGNLARCLNNLGAILLHMGNNGAALKSFTEAQPMARKLNDSRLELKLLINLGGIHLSTRNKAEARQAFERILAIGEGILSADDFATARMNLAASLPIPEEFDHATALYRSALQTARAIGSQRLVANGTNGLGTALQESGRPAAAIDQHSDALELAQAIGAQREQSAALRGLGQAEGSLGLIPIALDHLGQAALLARQIQAVEEEAYACEALAELQLRNGLHTEGRATARRAIKLLESINASGSEAIQKVYEEFKPFGEGNLPD
ncbi:tetratricopeptide repeat protein [Streptomyces sp. FH025]|uniref:AfsR/SARP family transcriptional regulator n=1 Tax=Streptomyces sp. FH025 TaxID=2815937 RepID=UPI001A9D49E9|nr:tetratricopeptide repeat protein [Streptomyces sp. FH025]MBO1414218.1 tetratricopeptide repeat protein [Streptomyces sp. FH025]